MYTTLIDSDACAPKDGIDEEAQTREKTDEKTRGEWRPYVTLLAFAFACVLLFTLNDSHLYRVENARVLESVRADVREIKETLYARAREYVPVDSDAMIYADPDVTDDAVDDGDSAYARDLTMRSKDREEIFDADLQTTDATDATDATADFGDFFGELLVKLVRRRR